MVLYHSTALRVIVAGQAPGAAQRRRTTSSWTRLVKSPGATSAIGTTCPHRRAASRSAYLGSAAFFYPARTERARGTTTSKSLLQVHCVLLAVGTLISERPPHRHVPRPRPRWGFCRSIDTYCTTAPPPFRGQTCCPRHPRAGASPVNPKRTCRQRAAARDPAPQCRFRRLDHFIAILG